MRELIEWLKANTDEGCTHCRETIEAMSKVYDIDAEGEKMPTWLLSFDRVGGRRWHIGRSE